MEEMVEVTIDEIAVQAAIDKWDGIGTTASDRIFLEEFSTGSINKKDLTTIFSDEYFKETYRRLQHFEKL